MDPSSSRRLLSMKVDHERCEDRISSLPDDIITRILSLLSTRDSVKTSILSSRWETMWASVPYLHFTIADDRWNDENYILGYMRFIDRILMLHTSSVLRFHLKWVPQIDMPRLSTWMSALLVRNIQEIDISSFHEQMKTMLPRRLFTSPTLIILKITFGLRFDVPSSIYLPGLKILSIMLQYPSNDLLEKILCSCPVLEELSIRLEIYSGTSIFNISSPTLKMLCIEIYSEESEHLGNAVTINASALSYLEVRDNCFVHYNLKNLSSLSKAYIDIDVVGLHGNIDLGGMESANELCKLLIAISNSNVQDLSIGPFAVDDYALAIGKEWPVLPNITRLHLEVFDFESTNIFSRYPTFPNVRQLLLDIEVFDLNILSYFFTLVPNLGYLVFEKVPILKSPLEFDPFEEQEVPKCLRSCLKKIEVRNFERNRGFELIEFLLKSAQVLEQLTVAVTHEKLVRVSKRMIQAEILAMPRISECSQVVFL